jgi:hypothetical protein
MPKTDIRSRSARDVLEFLESLGVEWAHVRCEVDLKIDPRNLHDSLYPITLRIEADFGKIDWERLQAFQGFVAP